MINKIKEFFKSKFSRRRAQEWEDEDEYEVVAEESDQETPPEVEALATTEDKIEESRVETPPQKLHEDFTPEFQKIPSPSKLEELKAILALKIADLSNRISIWRAKLSKVQIPKNAFNEKKFEANFNFLRASDSTKKIIVWLDKVLLPSSRETIHQTFLIFLIALVTYQIGKLTALAFKGTQLPHVAKHSEISVNVTDDFNANSLNIVKTLNPFRTDKGKGPVQIASQSKCESASQKTSLPLKLVNAVVLQDEVKSLASVQVRSDRKLLEVRIGDKIQNMAEIFKIKRDELVVKNLQTGACEAVKNDNAALAKSSPISVLSPSQSKAFLKNKTIPGIENSGNNFKISKSLINEKLKDIGQILTQAKAVPIQNPDGTMAFRMTEMDPEGIFPYLGLQDQDIITSINGQPIQNINEVMSLFGKIKNLENLSLGIRREGSEVTQEYQIK